MARSVAPWLGIAALVIGYSLLAHYTNESAQSGNLGALVAIAPVVLIALALAWRSPRRSIMLAVLALSGIALWAEWPELASHFGLVYWLQHVGMQLILFITFGRTLISGRQPLCTRFAEAVHVLVTPQHEIYTRQVTIALTSTLLFFLAPLVIWSVFANILTLPLVALMFIGEYWVRWWVLPEMRHMHLLDAVRAFRNASARSR